MSSTRSFKNELRKENQRILTDLRITHFMNNGTPGEEAINTFPLTGTQINRIIEEALSLTRMTAKATWDRWRQEEFATDVAAFNVWKTINARKIIGEYCTTLRRQLQEFRLKAVQYKKQQDIRYRESLYDFLEAIVNPTTWHLAIAGKRPISDTHLGSYGIFCIHSEKWTPKEILKYIDREVSFMKEYLISDQQSLAVAQRAIHMNLSKVLSTTPTRTDPMNLPKTDDELYMGYIDAELMSADNTTTRMENIIKEARKTNEEATVVANRLVTISQGNLPTT